MRSSPHWREIYLAVAFTTMATLLLELSLTRIFSVVFYYHFAFLAISIALFGLGLGGVASYVIAGQKAPLYLKLGRLSAVNSVLVVAALALILAQGTNPGNASLALIYFATALPFMVSGAIVSLIISETMEKVGRVYFFDLLGAAGGCFLLLALLPLAGGPGAVIGAALTFAVASAIWHSLAGSVPGRAGSVALALGLLALLIYNHEQPVLDITNAKGQKLANEVFHQWNSFSRVAVTQHADGVHSIVIDADAATDIARFDFGHLTPDQSRDLREQGPALPYNLRPGAKTLIIGPGGGWDVARALVSGSRDITAVEINPIISRVIMREKFPGWSNGLYLRPEVHLYEEDGRAFVRRSNDRFQVIQATLVDTWAATAAGAFALSENNLYTTNAFRDYLGHLTDDGVVAMSRWGFEPPRESLRLISLAIDALNQLGEREPKRHMIVARQGSVEGYGALDTVVVARKPLSESDIERAKAAIAAGHMEAVYYPGSAAKNQFRDLLLSASPADYEATYQFDISPVSDNRPFFFYTVQPRDLWRYMTTAARDKADFKINRAAPLLFVLAGISLFATLLVLIAPPVVLGTRLPSQPGVRGFLVYFLLIGAGYILVEVGLIQKFVLFLGHPTYALAVVIFSLLIWTGAGSFASQKLVGGNEGTLIKALGCVAMLTALWGAMLGSLLTVAVGLALPLKVGMTVLLIAPLGFGMGIPFPAGLRRLEAWHAPSVRWAWSLNAASSVLGSVMALVSSIYLGLVQTLIIGGLFYLGALAVIARVRINRPAEPEPGPNRVVLAS